MTNPFTSFAFAATAEPTNRTLPDRLAQIHNVKDFGATGDGVTDDLAAIQAAINWQIANTTRGTVYFPPGTYHVSGSINFDQPSGIDSGPLVGFAGEPGLSIITGNFADYVFRRGLVGTARISSICWHISRITIINQAAGGGGVRFGALEGGVISDCDITADIAITDDNTETFIDGGNLNGSFEVAIENCNLRPFNTRAAGSFGIIKLSNGPVTNCRMIGFDIGMGTGSGEGCATVRGCYFEANNIGISPSSVIEAWGGGGSNGTVRGCWFKNNGIAINQGGGGWAYQGNRIDAAVSAITPQYGIKTAVDNMACHFEGITVAGTYSGAGVLVAGGEAIRHLGTMAGIGSVSWTLPSSAMTAGFYKACNVAPVFTVAGLPAVTATVTSASWAAGIVTLNFSTPIDVSGLATKSANLTVTGVTPSGFNVSGVVGTMVSFSQLTYPLVSNPGTYVSGGSVFFSGMGGGIANAYEGETYDVSDANTAAWGAVVTAGGGSTHAKVRYTSSGWTVMGA